MHEIRNCIDFEGILWNILRNTGGYTKMYIILNFEVFFAKYGGWYCITMLIVALISSKKIIFY